MFFLIDIIYKAEYKYKELIWNIKSSFWNFNIIQSRNYSAYEFSSVETCTGIRYILLHPALAINEQLSLFIYCNIYSGFPEDIKYSYTKQILKQIE